MESLLELLIAHPLVYLLIDGSVAGSGMFPPLPSDSMLVAALGLAAAGDLVLWWVATENPLGGWTGDLLP